MKNITFRADETLIAAARARARIEHTTLNEQFHRWLFDYAGRQERITRYEETMAQLRGQVIFGRKLTRGEMNER